MLPTFPGRNRDPFRTEGKLRTTDVASDFLLQERFYVRLFNSL